VLISLAVLAGSSGGEGTLLIEAGTGLGVNLIFFVFEEGAILGVNFAEIFSESFRFIVSVQRVPTRLIDQRNKIPYHITNAIKILEFISRFQVYLFI